MLRYTVQPCFKLGFYTCTSFFGSCACFSLKMDVLQNCVFLVLGILFSHGFNNVCGKRAKKGHDYFSKIQDLFETNAANLTEEMLITQNVSQIGAEFDCPSSVSPEVPTSVHLLRPGDIKVIGAIGDSLTAAYAAGASTYTPVTFEYPGLSASVGGDKTLEKIVTLPNIFRKYNPHLYGYSTGISVIETQPLNKRFNFAISGSEAEDMPKQARDLIRAMKESPHVDFENDWKFITIFIGGNDLCSGCIFAGSSPEEYIEYLEKTIQIFHDKSPRTFLNVIGIIQVNQMVKMRGPIICNLMLSYYCPCALGGSIPEHFLYLKSREFQRLLRTSVQSGKFDDKDDFTAVYQPFMEDTVPPELPDGEVDRSYIAPDCFHLSQKGQAAQATANWNNLLEPVGSKDTSYDAGETLNCPSKDFPYIYTNVNSKPGFQSRLRSTSLNDVHIPMSNSSSTSKLRLHQDDNVISRTLP